MIPKIKIFYSQPVDNMPAITIKKNIEKFGKLIEDFPVEIVAPYIDDQNIITQRKLDRKIAQQIVKRDYAALDKCDILVADLSIENHQAIGMIFEIAHALLKKKKVLVYTGDSSLAYRVWIIANVDHICKTWLEGRNIIKHYITSTEE